MSDRFFVTIFATAERELRALREHDVYVFQATAREAEGGEAVIEGLLNLEEISALVRAGYRVLVEEEMSRRARAP